jgi:hypothetical protein
LLCLLQLLLQLPGLRLQLPRLLLQLLHLLLLPRHLLPALCQGGVMRLLCCQQLLLMLHLRDG